MNEVKTPKKPLIFYYVMVFLLLMMLNFMAIPWMAERQVREVDYGTFMTMTEDKKIAKVEIDESEIVFTDKDGNIYKTGPMNDPDLVQRLHDSGAEFASQIVEQMSPFLSALLGWIVPIAIFMIIVQVMYKRLMDKAGGGGNAMMFGMGKSNAKVYVKSSEGIKFTDVAGEDEAKENLTEIVDYLHNPDKYREIGASMPKGILLVGPPGTGKTSIARSVARALNKKYVRICLGGVRDEAEISGHRRTYIGAMPGRIAAGLHQAKVKNPLMLLDEIDKVSADYKGDTSSALLEVLDSEQNNKFADHYVELPIDLSEVLFIATANDIQNIPRPLLDRMEVIEISSYTENEKFHIAKEHLVPKQKKANGLKEAQLVIEDEALMEVISGYTREAGVRSLERQIGRICRKSARKILEEQVKEVVVTKENLEEFLGKERYEFQPANEKPEIGIVRGLAWTAVGGDTLQIEVNVMPGKGEFLLTGQLGDVMKESAQAGISFIRSVAEQYEIPKEFFEKHDIHIHIPEGAVPKDGPSAGITMATAMVSAITKVPVKADVAMTGEITLRGRVLPIGGLKEKLLAAKKAGIHMVLVPEKNEPDVRELDAEITDGLQIEFVGSMEQVLKLALVEKK